MENPKGDNAAQVLRITMEFEDVTIKTYTRTEIVQDSVLIESCVKDMNATEACHTVNLRCWRLDPRRENTGNLRESNDLFQLRTDFEQLFVKIVIN